VREEADDLRSGGEARGEGSSLLIGAGMSDSIRWSYARLWLANDSSTLLALRA